MTEQECAATFDFSVYRGRTGLEKIASEWSDFAQTLPNLRFMHCVEWIRSYIDSLAEPDADIMFVVARHTGTMVGVFPLRGVVRKYFGMRVRLLELLIHDHMILGDFVLPPAASHAGTFEAMRAWLMSQRDIACDVLMLDRIPESSITAQAIAQRRPPLTVPALLCKSSFVPCRATIDETLNDVSGSFKRNLRRLTRRAEEAAPLSFECVRDPTLLPQALQRFIAVEAAGWRGEHGTANAIKFNPNAIRFYECLIREFGASGRCVINLLRHGNQDVATQFALISGATLNILVIGFSEAHSSFAPGNLLMERTIKHFCSEGFAAVSFVSDPTWGHLWKPASENVLTFRLFKPSLRGVLLYAFLKVKHWRDKRRSMRETERPTEERAQRGDSENAPSQSPALQIQD